MRTRSASCASLGWIVAAAGAFSCSALGQGVAERAGQAIDGVGRGVRREAFVVTDAIRRRFETVRADVHRMGNNSRVYSRIHWDRTLHGSKIEVHMLRDGSVLLRGTVPDVAARDRAVAIARDTVDVPAVVDELTVLNPPVVVPAPAIAPAATRDRGR